MMDWSVVFLDRDGTINVKAPEGAYVARPDEIVLIDGAAQAIQRLNSSGLPVIVVTNQRGVALGRMTLEDVVEVNARVGELLLKSGASIRDYFICPHDRNACDCRKPDAGLLYRARSAYPWIDLRRAVIVGDAATDVLAGKRAGTWTVRISDVPDPSADVTVPSLPRAVDWILARGGSRCS